MPTQQRGSASSGGELDRATALVGLMQAMRMVDLAAFGNPIDEEALDQTIRTIFELQPESMASVIPKPRDFRLGWQVAAAMLEPPSPEILASMRYAFSIIELSTQLGRSRVVVDRLRAELGALAAPSDQADVRVTPRSKIPQIAEIYENTIGTLGRRLHVNGRQDVLTRADVQALVRTLLLAGIRFAWLWRQLGGRRWHLLLRRSSIRRQLAVLEATFT